MRFEKYELDEGMKLPAAELRLCGFDLQQTAECHMLKDAAVVLKKQMNASELIRAAWSLRQLSAELFAALAARCLACNDGELCGGAATGCPFDPLDFAADIDVPAELRELAGIEEGVPLHVELLEDGEITIAPNRDGPCLWDVPAPMMQALLAAGVCPASLESLLKSGDAVYGA